MKTVLESWTLGDVLAGTVLQIGYIEQDENYITFWISSVVIAVPEYVAITEILNVNSVRYKNSSVKCISKSQPTMLPWSFLWLFKPSTSLFVQTSSIQKFLRDC